MIIYTATFTEWFIRICAPQPMLPRYVTGTDAGIRGNIPNSSYTHSTPDTKRINMKINSAGMRSDREYSYTPSEGVCRVGLFGDSFFMGYEANYQESYAVQLERALYVKGMNCEVLNFSVSGFGTAESLIKLKADAKNYSLNIAILEWHKSDPWDNHRSLLYTIEDGKLKRDNAEFLPGISTRDSLMKYRVYKWLIEYSHLYSAIREKVGKSLKTLLSKYQLFVESLFYYEPEPTNEVPDPNIKPVDFTENTETEIPSVAISLSSLLIDEFHNSAKEMNIETILLEIPTHYTRSNKLESALDFLDGTLQSDITILSPMKRFSKLNENKIQLYYPNGHFHLSPTGYRELALVTAEEIYKKLSGK